MGRTATIEQHNYYIRRRDLLHSDNVSGLNRGHKFVLGISPCPFTKKSPAKFCKEVAEESALIFPKQFFGWTFLFQNMWENIYILLSNRNYLTNRNTIKGAFNWISANKTGMGRGRVQILVILCLPWFMETLLFLKINSKIRNKDHLTRKSLRWKYGSRTHLSFPGGSGGATRFAIILKECEECKWFFIGWLISAGTFTKPAFTCWKVTIATLEQSLKYV